jgi:hypothetical protein
VSRSCSRLHHGPVRPLDNSWALPTAWWSLTAWLNSPIYFYSLLGTEWREANALLDVMRRSAEISKERVFSLLYGHRHERYLGLLYDLHSTIQISEAPALFDVAGARAAYAVSEPSALKWHWLEY